MLLTDYCNVYGNYILTGHMLAMIIDQLTPTIPVEGRVTEGSRWRKKYQGIEKCQEEKGSYQEMRPSDYYGNR